MEAENDPLEYIIDLLRDGEISLDKFRYEARSIGYHDNEIDEILAEMGEETVPGFGRPGQ